MRRRNYRSWARGLTHVNEEYAKTPNGYRVAGPFVDLNFGLIEIDWEADGGTAISLAAIDVQGRTAFKRVVLLSALAPVPGAAAHTSGPVKPKR